MTRRFSAWLAILGMVLNALWPLLAHAAPREFVAPICSMVGTTAAQVMEGGLPPPAPLKSVAPHCPFCSLGSDQQPLLAAAEIPAFVPLLLAAPPPPAKIVVFSATIASAAHPRGPPSRPL
jgi:hypothetical protein